MTLNKVTACGTGTRRLHLKRKHMLLNLKKNKIGPPLTNRLSGSTETEELSHSRSNPLSQSLDVDFPLRNEMQLLESTHEPSTNGDPLNEHVCES